MNTDALKQLFRSFDQMNILVIGDVMVDSYLWGKVERISPEAPVPVVSVTRRENRLGGAANVGLNIRALGAKPMLCSVTGNDEKGNLFISLMKDAGLETSGLLVDENRKTTVKFRIISQGQHLLRVDEENDHCLDLSNEAAFKKRIGTLLDTQQFHAIVFEDYDKGCITPELIKHVVKLASSKNIPTLVDPKKRNFLEYKGVSLFKPNLKELAEGLKTEVSKSDIQSVVKAAQMLESRLQNRFTMVTLSENGIFISDRNRFHHFPAVVRDIADVSGAGDTVISVAALCLASGLDIADIAIIANLAGGLVCEKVGVVPVDKQQLLDECIRYYHPMSEE